jgi:hypothetical protein
VQNQESQNKSAAQSTAIDHAALAANAQTSSSQNDDARASFLTNATDLINRGLSVIPLVPHKKSPLLGATSRTTDKKLIAQWAEIWPDANVGVVSDENFTILETDDEAKLRDAVRGLTGQELPVTAACGSGRPNRCAFIFKRTPACGDACLEVPGVFEFRNRNQYVAAPGSIHPNGSVYRWLNDAAIAEMPDWLMTAIKKLDGEARGRGGSGHVEVSSVVPLRDAYLYDCNPDSLFGLKGVHIGEGERHYALLTLAGLLHDGERSAEQIADILKRVRDEYCTSGKGDAEIERLADYVCKREPSVIEPFNLPTFSVGTIAFGSKEQMAAWIAENPSRVTVTVREPELLDADGNPALFDPKKTPENGDMPADVLTGRLREIAEGRMSRFPMAYAAPSLLAVASAMHLGSVAAAMGSDPYRALCISNNGICGLAGQLRSCWQRESTSNCCEGIATNPRTVAFAHRTMPCRYWTASSLAGQSREYCSGAVCSV